MLSKEVSSTIFWVFGMIQPGIEPQSPRPLVNTLPTKNPVKSKKQVWDQSWLFYNFCCQVHIFYNKLLQIIIISIKEEST